MTTPNIFICKSCGEEKKYKGDMPHIKGFCCLRCMEDYSATHCTNCDKPIGQFEGLGYPSLARGSSHHSTTHPAKNSYDAFWNKARRTIVKVLCPECQKKYGIKNTRERLNSLHARACRSELLGQQMTPLQRFAYENFDYDGFDIEVAIPTATEYCEAD